MNTLLIITVGLVCFGLGALAVTVAALAWVHQALEEARVEGALVFFEKIRGMLEADDLFAGYYVDERGDYVQNKLYAGDK
jgi:hypothetical protein